MTREEELRAFDELHSLLASSPLAWILPNVDDEIQRGKPGTRTLEKSTGKEALYVEFREAGPVGRRRKVEEFTTVTPFEPSEKLDLLISSIERVLHEVPQLQLAALSSLKDYRISEVTFAEDASDRDYTIRLDSEIDLVSKRLSPLLAKVRD